MINSQDIKNGVCIRMDGRLYFVIEFLHVKPGKGNTIMRVKFKDVVDGRVLERRFNIGEKLEDVRVERRPYQFLYKEGEDYIFMNNETFEQVPIGHELITGVDFLKEGMNVELDKAIRLQDFITMGELIAYDALNRNESCGGHFREEYQTEEGEAKRDDENYFYVACWEYQGSDEKAPVLLKEPLVYEAIKVQTRNYKS